MVITEKKWNIFLGAWSTLWSKYIWDIKKEQSVYMHIRIYEVPFWTKGTQLDKNIITSNGVIDIYLPRYRRVKSLRTFAILITFSFIIIRNCTLRRWKMSNIDVRDGIVIYANIWKYLKGH